jgi:hypothetical protein
MGMSLLKSQISFNIIFFVNNGITSFYLGHLRCTFHRVEGWFHLDNFVPVVWSPHAPHAAYLVAKLVFVSKNAFCFNLDVYTLFYFGNWLFWEGVNFQGICDDANQTIKSMLQQT